MSEFSEGMVRPVDAAHRYEPVRELPKGTKLEHVALHTILPGALQEVSHALRIFPPENRGIPKEVAPFQAVVVVPENEQAGGEPGEVSYFFTPGITARSKHMTPIVSEVAKASVDKLGKTLGFAAALSSSGSVDVIDAAFEKDPLLRAIPQAVMAVNLIREHPTKKVVFLGHSLGASETPYIAALVEQMLKDQNIPTEVAGMILENPGGQYTMGLAETAVGFGMSIVKNAGAIREAFPSWNEVFAAQEALGKAGETQDAGEVLHRAIRLKELREKVENLTGIPDEKRERVKAINDAMYEAWQARNTSAIKKLGKERDKLLVEDFEEHMGLTYDEMNRKGNQSTPRLLNASSKIIRGEGRVNNAHPDWIRRLIKFPVGFLRSEGDVLFKPSEVTQSKMTLEELARRGVLRDANLTEQEVVDQAKFLPEAPVVFNARVLGTTHIISGNHPERYAGMVADMTRRMEEVNDKKDSTAPIPQREVNLTYSGDSLQ